MEEYLITKILSNNVVLVTKQNKDFILVGKGIGFGKKKGQFISNLKDIENTFVSLEGINSGEYKDLLSKVDPQIIELTQDIVKMVSEEIDENLNPHFHLGLIDHINFAIKRLKEGIEIVNPFLSETKLLYPKEFGLAQRSVKILRNNLNIDIPEAEVGFITFHIYGATNDKTKNDAFKNSKIISKIIQFIQRKLEINLDKNSFNYVRFVSHIRGVLDRIKRNKTVTNVFLNQLKNDLSYEFKVAYDISKIIENDLKIKVPEDEIGFIALHLYKLRLSSEESSPSER
ncbi:PRD domain-containing protein [Clostridium sp. D2Q-11]|uniref:PRD domain-containing protein n=1 Tax=Anaeromonas frigoriresistens TaxID=2683708 RepID=A0A942Z5B4_9FIRM|nr:PRD domain-containing protein [Anaeromonas frigoriresistens]MBS4537246.1 PRD domain-containing protein [Anaeromonas frigoriresistens]